MTNSPNSPTHNDAVLGHSLQPDIAVLGGIEGLHQKLNSSLESVRVAALAQAEQYGQAGLALLAQSLQDSSLTVQKTAYRLLRDRHLDPIVQQPFWEYSYQHLSCLYRWNSMPDTMAINTASLSADGKTLAHWHSQDMTIKLWDFDPKQAIATALNGMKDHLYTVKVWDLTTRTIIQTLHTPELQAGQVAISPDGRLLLSCSCRGEADQTIKLWDIPTGRSFRNLTVPHTMKFAVSPTWQTVFCGDDQGTIHAIDLHTGERNAQFYVGRGFFSRLVVSPDGNFLAVQSRTHTHDLALWHVPTQRAIALPPSGRGYSSLSFSGDSQYLALEQQSKILILSTQTGEIIHTLELEKPWYPAGLSLSPVSPILFVYCQRVLPGTNHHQYCVQAWNWQTQNLAHTFTPEFDGLSPSALVSADGQHLILAGYRSFEIWGVSC
jgi:WD40 repeat protein